MSDLQQHATPTLAPGTGLRRLLFVLPLAAFAAIAVWFWVGLGRDPAAIPSNLLNREVPAFALAAVPGTTIPALASDDIKGKVALVNMFASWCLPCRTEHPILLRLKREGRVAIYGVNYKDKAPDAKKWLDDLGNPYNAIGHDLDGRVGIDFGVTGVPETFVVDRAGRIRYKHVGPITPRDLDQTLLPLIAQLEKP
jgi:cytochrome c biogenesis protein CcmG, thiol:disulfide interchange protein DsbE